MRRVAFMLAGLLLLAVVTPPPAAVGQVMGLYYQEAEKDGRIYVFNTPEKYASWQASGDMGIAVTLIGRGPNGETLVGENETAIDLYLFRHNLPGYDRTSPKPPPPPDPNAWYNKVKVGGYAFGDAYAVIDNHDKVVEDTVDGGFWLRRAYLTVDNTFNANFSSRLRFEMNSPGDFKTTGSITPFVKDAYLTYKRNSGTTSLIAGIQPTPTFEAIENFWGYRSVEKTPVDLQRLQGSRDFGLALKGTAAAGKFHYHGMVANGANVPQEINDGKLLALALAYYPTPNFFFEGYADTEERPAKEKRKTFQGFVGFQGAWGRAGAQYTKQNRTQPGKADVDIALASGFAVFKLNPKFNLLARYDHVMDPNPGASGIAYLPMVNNAESQLAIVGLDWTIAPKINLIPNIEHVTYKAISGKDPSDDTLARVTLYFQF